jgi:hypothetical protein
VCLNQQSPRQCYVRVQATFFYSTEVESHSDGKNLCLSHSCPALYQLPSFAPTNRLLVLTTHGRTRRRGHVEPHSTVKCEPVYTEGHSTWKHGTKKWSQSAKFPMMNHAMFYYHSMIVMSLDSIVILCKQHLACNRNYWATLRETENTSCQTPST